MKHYEELTAASTDQTDSLNLKTRDLRERLAEVQEVRKQKEECNEFIEAMIKPKKAFVSKADLYPNSEDMDGTHPIIALLNLSRKESEKVNATIEEEISELHTQRDRYQRLWDVRRENFDAMMTAVERYRGAILSTFDDEEPIDSPSSNDEDVEMSDIQSIAEP
jgi:hypothetical protein